MLAGLRPAELVVLVTIDVVRDTPLDCHFSAWSRPKPAPDPPLGPSVASGVIPTKGGKNEVLQPPAGRAPAGRWRSSPWKRCNHAAPRGRVREHPAPLGALRLLLPVEVGVGDIGQGAPRTARCIKTELIELIELVVHVREHPAPLGALRLSRLKRASQCRAVREHPSTALAPLAWTGQGLFAGVGAQGVCFRVQAVCRSCGVGGGRRRAGGRGACWWRGAVLHIHPGVLVGSLASFQRFPAPWDVRGQDECATRAPLHIHPVSGPWFARQIRVVPPFTDRGL